MQAETSVETYFRPKSDWPSLRTFDNHCTRGTNLVGDLGMCVRTTDMCVLQPSNPIFGLCPVCVLTCMCKDVYRKANGSIAYDCKRVETT